MIKVTRKVWWDDIWNVFGFCWFQILDSAGMYPVGLTAWSRSLVLCGWNHGIGGHGLFCHWAFNGTNNVVKIWGKSKDIAFGSTARHFMRFLKLFYWCRWLISLMQVRSGDDHGTHSVHSFRRNNSRNTTSAAKYLQALLSANREERLCYTSRS